MSIHTYSPSIVKDRKRCLVFELFCFGKFNMVSLCVQEFLHKGDICGFGEPALLIQQGQDTRRVVLQRICTVVTKFDRHFLLKQNKSFKCLRRLFGLSVTHWSLDELDARLQVQTKVDEVPLDALPLILLLLQDEHGVVEELLQLLICVVDTQLLKGVILQQPKHRAKDTHPAWT